MKKIWILFLASLWFHTAKADSLALDGSLGTIETLKGPHFVIEARMGVQVGNNLFHSFKDFNLNTQESVTFRGPATIERVINRVTGGQSSLIDGLIQSEMPLADVYFLNPAGILFGKNAQLNIPGGFYVSTADYLKLGTDGQFNAKHPEQSSLTMAPPSAFGFIGEQIAPIEINGSFLKITTNRAIQQQVKGEMVTKGNHLTFIGGDLTLRGYTSVNSSGKVEQGGILLAFGGQIHLAGLAEPAEIPTDLSILPSRLGTITIVNTTSGRVTITDSIGKSSEATPDLLRTGNLDTTGLGGGKIDIHAQRIILDNAYIFADTLGNQNGQGVTLSATDEIVLRNGSRLTATAFEDNFPGKSTGNAGAIDLTTTHLTLTEGSQISTATRTPGQAGKITIATDQLSIVGHTEIVGVGFVNSAILNSTLSEGQGGEVNITAKEVMLDQRGEIRLETHGRANGGRLTLTTERLQLRQGGQLNVSTGQREDQKTNNQQRTGSAGDMTITAQASVVIDGAEGKEHPSGLLSNTFNRGYGGKVTINSPQLVVQNGGVIQAGTQYQGQGGTIALNLINLSIAQGGSIATTSLDSGQAGNIEIQAHQTVDLSGSMPTRGAMSSQSYGSGNAGTINLTTEQLRMNHASITTEALAARGGKVILNVEKFAYLVDSQVTVKAMGTDLTDEGGNILATAHSPLFFILKRSVMDASGIGGNAGNIGIAAENFVKSADSFLNVTSKLGINGKIEIISPNEEISDNFTILSSALTDVTDLFKQCHFAFDEQVNHFITTPHFWGKPPSAEDWQRMFSSESMLFKR